MNITYNGTTYTLTNAQLEGLRQAAISTSGAFSMERRNDATEAKLAAMGLLVEDFCYRTLEERSRMRQSITESLEAALNTLRTKRATTGVLGNRHALAQAQDDAQAAQLLRSASHEIAAMMNRRHYLTEAGYAIVLQRFPMGPVFLPAEFSHLSPSRPYQETK